MAALPAAGDRGGAHRGGVRRVVRRCGREQLPGGTLDILRNTAGMTGIGLLLAAVIGGALAWVGPMAYMIVACSR